MSNMINNPYLLSCAIVCFVVYFQYNKPDLHNLPLALSAFGPSLMQPNSYCIIHVFKIANILLGDRYYYNTFNNANNDNNNDEPYYNELALISSDQLSNLKTVKKFRRGMLSKATKVSLEEHFVFKEFNVFKDTDKQIYQRLLGPSTAVEAAR